MLQGILCTTMEHCKLTFVLPAVTSCKNFSSFSIPTFFILYCRYQTNVNVGMRILYMHKLLPSDYFLSQIMLSRWPMTQYFNWNYEWVNNGTVWYLRGVTMKTLALNLRQRFGAPFLKYPANAFCSNGEREYVIILLYLPILPKCFPMMSYCRIEQNKHSKKISVIHQLATIAYCHCQPKNTQQEEYVSTVVLNTCLNAT